MNATPQLNAQQEKVIGLLTDLQPLALQYDNAVIEWIKANPSFDRTMHIGHTLVNAIEYKLQEARKGYTTNQTALVQAIGPNDLSLVIATHPEYDGVVGIVYADEVKQSTFRIDCTVGSINELVEHVQELLSTTIMEVQ